MRYAREARKGNFNRMQSGLPFELVFLAPPPSLLAGETVPLGYVTHLAFWLMFHADPNKVSQYLLGSNFATHVEGYSLADWLHHYEYLKDGYFEAVQLYEALNVYSLLWALMSAAHLEERSAVERRAETWLRRQLRDEAAMDYLREWPERSRFPHPLGILVGNLLATFSFFKSERTDFIFEFAQGLAMQGTEIRPFAQFFV